jgi:hypothetical protein
VEKDSLRSYWGSDPPDAALPKQSIKVTCSGEARDFPRKESGVDESMRQQLARYLLRRAVFRTIRVDESDSNRRQQEGTQIHHLREASDIPGGMANLSTQALDEWHCPSLMVPYGQMQRGHRAIRVQSTEYGIGD